MPEHLNPFYAHLDLLTRSSPETFEEYAESVDLYDRYRQRSSPADWEFAATRLRLCHCCAGPAIGYNCKKCHLHVPYGDFREPGEPWEKFVAMELAGLEEGERSSICPKCHQWNSNNPDSIYEYGKQHKRRLLEDGETNLCQECARHDPEYNAAIDRRIRAHEAEMAALEETSTARTPKHKTPTPSRGPDGWVYFIADVDEKFVKIGWSSNRACRIKELQTGSPLALKLLSRERAAHPRKRERELHATFAHLRVRGEWYKMAPEIAKRIAHKPKVTE